MSATPANAVLQVLRTARFCRVEELAPVVGVSPKRARAVLAGLRDRDLVESQPTSWPKVWSLTPCGMRTARGIPPIPLPLRLQRSGRPNSDKTAILTALHTEGVLSTEQLLSLSKSPRLRKALLDLHQAKEVLRIGGGSWILASDATQNARGR